MADDRRPRSKKPTSPKDQWYRILDDNEDFQQLLENLGAVISESDPKGNISYVSRTIEAMVGYSRDELLGQLEDHRIHPDEVGEVRARKAKPIDEVGKQSVRYRVLAQDGSWRWIETVGGTRFVGDDGGVYGVSFSRDVSELQMAEMALLETAERYSRIIEAADFLIFEGDFEGNLRFASENCERILGFTSEELTAQPPFALLHPDDRSRLVDQFRQAVETGKPTVLDGYRTQHADGRWLWFQSTGVGYTRPDGEKRWLNITRDITGRVDRARDRAESQARSEQASRLQSLGLMAGGVAHDFNNLLTPILGQASLALADVPGESPLRMRLERIQRAARRASELTQQMMAYAGADEMQAETVQLSEFVESTCRLLDAKLAPGVTLTLELEPDLAPITADAGQLTQVVMNLITNANESVDHSNGQIWVRTGKILFETPVESVFLEAPLPPGAYVFVEVEDNGCGMDSATRARVFDPFYTTKFTGRGLGLASVLGILRAHRGTIELESELGEGSRFRALLAAGESTVHGPSKRSIEHESEPAGRPTILVIDDDEDARDVVTGSLERAGMEVLAAADGPAGLELFEARRADIAAVLLDRVMPVVSGEETFERLREAGAEIPILLMSGYAEKGDAAKFAARGAAGIIKKPFLPDELCARVRELLGQS